ncbi:MAG TPA: cytochrome C biogenesis protein, partial [Verrucomicrobiae bacterium]|nr:cytochrome C biogenesis protein [Verrucomicrobiae bacterium]
MKKLLPILITAVMAGWFLNTLRPPQEESFAFSEFGKLPILSSGRVQPIDSLARNSLMQIRHVQEANLEPWKGMSGKPRIISATEWLANVMMNPAVADDWPVFRVDNQELISLLKLPGKDLTQHQDGEHYSWNQIQPALQSFGPESDRIEKIAASQRNAYEKSVVKMRDRIFLYLQLKNAVQPGDAENWSQELKEYEKVIPAGVAALQAEQAKQKYDEAVLSQLAGFVERFRAMSNFEPPLVVPPLAPDLARNAWKRTGDVLIETLRDEKADPSVHAYAAMGAALQAGDAAEFNRQLVQYRSDLVPRFSAELRKARWEVFFNRMQPFYNAMVIYILAALLAFLFWFNLSESLRSSAVWLIGLALAIHTTGLIFRMVLEGRPPVTNLYSSAIFIGFGAVVLGLILERFYRNGIGAVVASGIGFITLIIAHHLAFTGDTMEMMQAVLD